MMSNQNQSRVGIQQDSKSIFLWYFLFGILHETSHIFCWLGLAWWHGYDFTLLGAPHVLAIEVILGRQCSLPSLHGGLDGSVRHAGWISSCFFFIVLVILLRYKELNKNILLVAFLTALEAITTDLIGLNPAINLGTTYFCGNFGIIFLNEHWFKNRQTEAEALDMLQQMIEVTMIRGAQSGGVVAYDFNNISKQRNGEDKAYHPRKVSSKAIRSRLVNKKRTDLSQLLRVKVQRDLRRAMLFDSDRFIPRIFAGHTRFATSSIATLDGSHPHRWTPPSKRRVYSMESPSGKMKIPQPTVVTVENYITHNGDFDFYQCHGKTHELETVQAWLSVVTGTIPPSSVDSCAIAGCMDILRTQGCFGLSARYSLALEMTSSSFHLSRQKWTSSSYSFLQDVIGMAFEKALEQFYRGVNINETSIPTLREVGYNLESRTLLQKMAFNMLKQLPEFHKQTLNELLMQGDTRSKNHTTTDSIIISEDDSDDENPNPFDNHLRDFCQHTVDAFFDNDLFMTTKIFMKRAIGSFGLTFTSTLDSHRQVCLAARGQTMSIAFYPNKDLICYGSEQAACKAGMDTGSENLHHDHDDATRLDLDELGGEIVLLDWGLQPGPVSFPSRNLEEVRLMNGKLVAVMYQESKATATNPTQRMMRLSDNPLIRPLQKSVDDPVLNDIKDIPSVCKNIQDEWYSASSYNRLTAFNLSRCLRNRLEMHIKGTANSIDLLVTGCEVSLYLAEQFASDLKKAFPKLHIEALSSNKLLGIYGQEISVPDVGFPHSQKTRNLHDTIVLIVSHSGGSFAPLACSSLLQSFTKSIYVVTSEFDTAIGRNLHLMNDAEGHFLNQRIFSTGIGMRPAEPASVSVAATHQLLTNLFQYLSVIVLSDDRYIGVTNSQINEQDVATLEKCNQMNIQALTEICGFNACGFPLDHISSLLRNLRELGTLWADHILEQTRAHIMCFIYIIATVTSGWPLVSALGSAFGVDESFSYILRFLDSLIYFFLPQICITFIRLFQGRNLRHRMTVRTLVIADIPWVSQCADAFLSKLFGVSYSIAGLNVYSGNPNDHFVHRLTHRIVRGTLIIFGRPDGRLSALSTAEMACALSHNQASSIQSFGSTCESVTIGHNPFKLQLSKSAIFLKRHRPLFLCERLLVETDAKEETKNRQTRTLEGIESVESQRQHGCRNFFRTLSSFFRKSNSHNTPLSMSIHQMLDCSISLKIHKKRSSQALLGAYLDINNQCKIHESENEQGNSKSTVDDIVASAIRDRKNNDRLHILFKTFDKDLDGFLSESEFVNGIKILDSSLTEIEIKNMFGEADVSHSGTLDYTEFISFLRRMGYDRQVKIPSGNRDNRGLIKIKASRERYFGETLRKYNAGKQNVKDMDFVLAESQHLVQELYEARIASMQRFVAMCVLFYHISRRVERFFSKISCGYWSYRMDRTHSILRVATTASPISGSDVRHRIERLRLWRKVLHSVHIIEITYIDYRKRKFEKITNLSQND